MMATDHLARSSPYVRPPLRPQASSEHLMSGAAGTRRLSPSFRTSSPVPDIASRSRDHLLAQEPGASDQLPTETTYKPKQLPKDEDDLTFRPTILKYPCTIVLVLLYITVAIGIVVLWWRSGDDRQFSISSENVHMIARYFPSIIGTITVLFFHRTVREFIRITPYVNMANPDGPGAAPWRSVSGAFFPWQDLFVTKGITPVLSLFCSFVASFVVSFKVALLGTVQNGKSWTLTVRTVPAIFLIGGYVLMAGYTAHVAIRLKGKSTGLKWDPVSIADYLALFANCNALTYFEPLELMHETSAKDAMSSKQWFRIGYWEKQTAGAPPETVYGIGVDWGAEHAPNVKSNKLKLPGPLLLDSVRDGTEYDYTKRLNPEHYPYLHNPGFPPWTLIIAAVIVYSALTASIVALYKQWPMQGFHMSDEWAWSGFNVTFTTHSLNVSSEDHGGHNDAQSELLVYALLFRSAPTYVAVIFINTIIPAIDLHMRFIEPFVGMFEEPGDASKTVLLSYITASPLQVPLEAYDNGHYKVSWFSTLNTLSPLFPIFVGALLTVNYDDGSAKPVKMMFSLSAYIGVMVFLVLYGLSFPFAWPNPHRLLPRQFYSLADLMAMCHRSRFLASPDLQITDKRCTPTKQHMEARILLSGPKFRFGIYTDFDGNPHLGFDQVGTTNYEDKGKYSDLFLDNDKKYPLVQWIEPGGRWHKWQNERHRAVTNMIYRNPRTTRTGIMEAGLLQSWFGSEARRIHSQEEGSGGAMHEMDALTSGDPNAQASGSDARPSGGVAGLGGGGVDSLVTSLAAGDDQARLLSHQGPSSPTDAAPRRPRTVRTPTP